MNFNKCFEVGGAETFALPLGINDSRQSDVIVVYETYDTANENALWQVQLDTAKDNRFYVRPSSSSGKSFQKPLAELINSILHYEPPAGKVSYMYVLRNDTIFWLEIYKTDSIVVRDTNIAIGNGWWLMLSPNNENIVMRRFRRIHSSQDLKKIKEVIIAESEMQMTRFLKYNKELMLCQYFWRMGHLAYSSGEIKQPKRRMRKKLMNSYIKYANTTH